MADSRVSQLPRNLSAGFILVDDPNIGVGKYDLSGKQDALSQQQLDNIENIPDKQDLLTAGDGIDISNNVISAKQKIHRLGLFNADNYVRDLEIADENDSTHYAKATRKVVNDAILAREIIVLFNFSTNKLSSFKVFYDAGSASGSTTITVSAVSVGLGSIDDAAYTMALGSIFAASSSDDALFEYDSSYFITRYIGPLKNEYALSPQSSISITNNSFSTVANTSLSAITLALTKSSSEVANFAVEITTEVNCTLSVTINGTAAKYSVAAGNTLEAGKTYQVTCVGTCWTLAEFAAPAST